MIENGDKNPSTLTAEDVMLLSEQEWDSSEEKLLSTVRLLRNAFALNEGLRSSLGNHKEIVAFVRQLARTCCFENGNETKPSELRALVAIQMLNNASVGNGAFVRDVLKAEFLKLILSYVSTDSNEFQSEIVFKTVNASCGALLHVLR